MLAQHFMTADELKIDATTHGALIKVLGMLERGEVKHHKSPGFLHYYGRSLEDRDLKVDLDKVTFSMERWLTPIYAMGSNDPTEQQDRHCGTICCMGGLCEIIMKVPIPASQKLEWDGIALHDLFMNELAILNDPPPAVAAQALRNYLTTGSARWSEVLGASS